MMEWEPFDPFAGLVCQSATMQAYCHVCDQSQPVELQRATYVPKLVRVDSGPEGGDIEDFLRAALERRTFAGFRIRCLVCDAVLPPCVTLNADIVLWPTPNSVSFRVEVTPS